MSDLVRPPDWEEPVELPPVAAPQRVCVPFDGSHTAERALAWAQLVARATKAEIVVVVAYEPPLTLRGRGSLYVTHTRAELAEEATALAEESVLLLRNQGLEARGIVVTGDPARGILDVVDDEACDLIVMGRKGLTAELEGAPGAVQRFREILAGGVAEKIARHATVPVLLVS